MILALSIGVSVLTAALFFRDFFEDWRDFTGGLGRRLRGGHDLGSRSLADDPEGVDDNGFARLRILLYLAIVIGSGVVVFAIFRSYFGPEI